MKKIFFILFSLLFHAAIFAMLFDFSETIFQESKWAGEKNMVLNPIFVELSSSGAVEKYRDPRGGWAKSFAPTAKIKDHIVQQGNHNGLDKDSKAETAPTLLALIRKKIAEKQIYPPQALERGLSGTVKITFKINTNGNLDYTKISSSSGSQILDDSALLAVKKSIPLPYFPHAITLPIAYELK